VLLAEVIDPDGVIALAIIDGNRRIRAAQAARLPKVPAVVLKATTAQDRARLTLMCNYMRSANFHTESAAIMALATDEDAAAQAAREIGLGPVKVPQLYRRIATMPGAVRQAMYEHRLPVTAATWVGSWPEGLQQEVVELLGRRRYVNTTMMKDLREWYAERHPDQFGVMEKAREEVPFDEWSDTALHVVDIPVPPSMPEAAPAPRGGPADIAGDKYHPVPTAPHQPSTAMMAAQYVNWTDQQPGADPTQAPPALGRREDDGALRTAEPRSDLRVAAPSSPPLPIMLSDHRAGPVATLPAAPALTASAAAVSPKPETTMDEGDRTEHMMAFVVRLDAALRDLAGEGHALGISRSVWVDRTMRAWDGIGG
jgi:hypothetical protein